MQMLMAYPLFPPQSEHLLDVNVFNIGKVEALPVTSVQLKAATKQDPVLSQVLRYCTRQGWPHKVPDVLKPYSTRQVEITLEDGCVMWGI